MTEISIITQRGTKETLSTPAPPYFILWNAVTSLGENTVI